MTTAPTLAPDRLLTTILPGLAPLPEGLAAAVAREGTLVERPASTVLFERGDPCLGFLVLDRGVLRVSRAGGGGRELLLYRLRPGEVCVITLGCLLAGTEYPARAVVEEDLHGVLLPPALFERLNSESAPFRHVVFGAFASRIDHLLDLTANVAFDPLDRRLASALVEHVRATGRAELRRTHAQLAAEIGSVRERVSRLLEGFAAQGAVSLGRGRVRVLDRAALERIASG